MKQVNKLFALACAVILFSASASFNIYDFGDDSVKEQRFRTLISELRCPKCQNNNLADSNAPLASDIKAYVYRSVKDGKSDDDIVNFLVSRYGTFIVYDPKVMWLWLIPLVVAVFGLLFVLRQMQMKNRSTQNNNTLANVPSMESLIREYEQQQRGDIDNMNKGERDQ